MRLMDVMTSNVIMVKEDTPVVDAQKLMKDRKIRRLPVVDDKGRPVGIVTQERLDNLAPSAGTPVLWQIHYMVAHTTVGDVMRKELITLAPTDSVEYAVAKAQSNKVGTIIVVENDKMVGIVTTNDIFYRVVNPLLGIGEKGSRIIVIDGGEIEHAARIITHVSQKSVKTKVIWAITSPSVNKNNLVLHLDIENPDAIIKEIAGMGYEVHAQQR